jgi:hypothetical protein
MALSGSYRGWMRLGASVLVMALPVATGGRSTNPMVGQGGVVFRP